MCEKSYGNLLLCKLVKKYILRNLNAVSCMGRQCFPKMTWLLNENLSVGCGIFSYKSLVREAPQTAQATVSVFLVVHHNPLGEDKTLLVEGHREI